MKRGYGKKGEIPLFHPDSKQLTEEALSNCRVCGVDPKELIPR